MGFYLNADRELVFSETQSAGLTIPEPGYLLADGSTVPDFTELDKFEKKADGSMYKFYKADKTPDHVRIATEELKDSSLQVQRNREADYAPDGEQLDLLYHDITAGTFGEAAKLSGFYLGRKAVKDKHTKG
jgi:hypothetical protein